MPPRFKFHIPEVHTCHHRKETERRGHCENTDGRSTLVTRQRSANHKVTCEKLENVCKASNPCRVSEYVSTKQQERHCRHTTHMMDMRVTAKLLEPRKNNNPAPETGPGKAKPPTIHFTCFSFGHALLVLVSGLLLDLGWTRL